MHEWGPLASFGLLNRSLKRSAPHIVGVGITPLFRAAVMKLNRSTFYISLLLIAFVMLHSQSRTALMERARSPVEDASYLPSAEILRALALNYDTSAATLSWIQALIYYGDWRLSPHARRSPPRHLEHYARVVADLDPLFFDVYEWFNATYLASRVGPISAQDISAVNRFLDQGIEHFPDRPEIAQLAGFNYIGYAKKYEPRQRVQELERAIAYLRIAARNESSLPTLTGTIVQLQIRRDKLERQLDADALPAEMDKTEVNLFLETLALTRDEQARARLIGILLELGLTRDDIEQSTKGDTRRLGERHECSGFSYLPRALWLQVDYPTGVSPKASESCKTNL